MHCVQKYNRFIREVREAHVFKYSKEKEGRGGGIVVKSDAHEIPINVTTQENINALLADG